MDFLIEDYETICEDSCVSWEALCGSTVLVTGATGLVGSFLIKALCHYSRKNCGNIRIVALVRSYDKARSVFGALCDEKYLSFITADITKSFAVLGQIDYVIHGASITASCTMVEHPVQTLETAIEGTRAILEIAKKKQIKSMVYISSMEVYGITDPQKHRIFEKDLGYIDVLNPRSSYSEGKRICECLCAAYCSEFGVPVKIARLAQTFGAGVSKQEARVFAQFAKSALRGEDIVLHTKGESYGNYCYTADVVRALLCILTKGKNQEAYTVVNEETTMRIREMAQVVAENISGGKSKVIFDIPQNASALGYAPDSTMRLSSQKLRELGWAPQHGLIEMYRRMIAGWNESSYS